MYTYDRAKISTISVFQEHKNKRPKIKPDPKKSINLPVDLIQSAHVQD